MQSYSQAYQDIFVISMLSHKRNGYFLEIGSNHPIINNNTYLLEKEFNWTGLMVEYDKTFKTLYDEHRPNSIYELNDARYVNYINIFNNNNYPYNMDYLQIDLEVNNASTLSVLYTLNKTILDKYKFATITFEHDIYAGNYFDTKQEAYNIFNSRGYILIYPDVKVNWCNRYQPFEDWYVHPDLVDINIINKYKNDKSLNCDEIYNILIQ
jgi:hypothetical protein